MPILIIATVMVVFITILEFVPSKKTRDKKFRRKEKELLRNIKSSEGIIRDTFKEIRAIYSQTPDKTDEDRLKNPSHPSIYDSEKIEQMRLRSYLIYKEFCRLDAYNTSFVSMHSKRKVEMKLNRTITQFMEDVKYGTFDEKTAAEQENFLYTILSNKEALDKAVFKINGKMVVTFKIGMTDNPKVAASFILQQLTTNTKNTRIDMVSYANCGSVPVITVSEER